MEEWGGGEGNVALQHKLGHHRQGWGRALPHGNSMPRVSPSLFWVQEPSPGSPPQPVPGGIGQVSNQPHSSPLVLSSEVN